MAELPPCPCEGSDPVFFLADEGTGLLPAQEHGNGRAEAAQPPCPCEGRDPVFFLAAGKALGSCLRRSALVKPINPWPMIAMLILVCGLIYWVLYR